MGWPWPSMNECCPSNGPSSTSRVTGSPKIAPTTTSRRNPLRSEARVSPSLRKYRMRPSGPVGAGGGSRQQSPCPAPRSGARRTGHGLRARANSPGPDAAASGLRIVLDDFGAVFYGFQLGEKRLHGVQPPGSILGDALYLGLELSTRPAHAFGFAQQRELHRPA